MRWKRIWENVIIGALIAVLTAIVLFIVAGLYFGDALIIRLHLDDVEAVYQETAVRQDSKIYSLEERLAHLEKWSNEVADNLLYFAGKANDEQDEKIEILRTQVNQLSLKKWHR